MGDREQVSGHLSKILDKLGHNLQMREFRRAAYREHDQLSNIDSYTTGGTRITGGSKGEGLTKPLESDIDWLFFNNNSVCVEENIDTYLFGGSMTVFTMNTRYCYPGYALLCLAQMSAIIPAIVYDSLFPSPNGQYFLSSDKLGEDALRYHKDGQGDNVNSRTGPATSLSFGMRDYDAVYSLRCMCPSILQEWTMRPRQYDWPPLALRYRALQIGANVVATGFKDSPMKPFEWRICFNEIEILLVSSLNDIQTKVYILLKMIMKNVLKPKEKEVTSYVMKNIVFWLAEKNPQDAFDDKNLLRWTLKALRLLKRSIRIQYLPYFMIPGRNLLVERINPHLRNRLVRRITCLLQEGPCLLWRCKKLTGTRLMTIVELNMFGAKRDELEILWLTHENYLPFLIMNGLSKEQILYDERRHALFLRMYTLTNSNWPRFIHEQFNAGMGVFVRMQIILSF